MSFEAEAWGSNVPQTTAPGLGVYSWGLSWHDLNSVRFVENPAFIVNLSKISKVRRDLTENFKNKYFGGSRFLTYIRTSCPYLYICLCNYIYFIHTYKIYFHLQFGGHTPEYCVLGERVKDEKFEAWQQWDKKTSQCLSVSILNLKYSFVQIITSDLKDSHKQFSVRLLLNRGKEHLICFIVV